MEKEGPRKGCSSLNREDCHKKKLCFLFVSGDGYPPFRMDVATLFGEEFRKKGHHIDWILQSKEICKKACRDEWRGYNVWVGPYKGNVRLQDKIISHLQSLKNDIKIFPLLNKKKYDFIQVKDKILSAVICLAAAKMHRTKFTYWISWPYPEESMFIARETTRLRIKLIYYLKGIILKYLLYRIILPRAAHIFVQSDQMKSDIANMGIDVHKMTPVPMGVSFEQISDSVKEGMTADHNVVEKRAPVIAYLGTLSNIRKLDFAVRVLEKVAKAKRDATLIFIGGSNKPSDIKIITDEAKKLGVQEKVSITGNLLMKDAWRETLRADVCIAPLYPTEILNSCSPTKIVEYMALGKPVVANDQPDQKKVLTESRGGLCVPYDEQRFAEAILTILNNPLIAKEMGMRGLEYVKKNRDYIAIADLVERQYYRLINCTADQS